MASGSGFGVAAAMARVAQLQTLAPTPSPAPAPAVSAGGTEGSTFRDVLTRSLAAPAAVPEPGGLSGPGGLSSPVLTAPGTVSSAALGAAGLAPVGAVAPVSGAAAVRVAVAQAEVGVAELPPGSNDGPRIADYRRATPGAGVGPWCSYFVSWVAAQAGTPLGPGGRGEGYVPALAADLSARGAYVPAQAARPQPGDLAFFDRNGDGTLDHVGLVEAVDADGTVRTIEGNSSNAVARRSYSPGGVTAYGRLH